MSNIQNKKLCDRARIIQNVLKDGYYLAEWFLTQDQGKALFLVQEGKHPSEGVYICSL